MMKVHYSFLYLLINAIISHAQILEGLKDAVLNAEGIVSDVFKSLDSLARQLKFSREFLQDSVEENCKYLCSDGAIPRKNKYHTPSSNGCGVPGVEIKEPGFLPPNEMKKCCDQHDICYGTCNKDKDECDLVFKKCLYKLCESSKGKMSETLSTGCKATAKTLYTGTTMFGCNFYKTSQEQACYCQPQPKKKFTGDEF